MAGAGHRQKMVGFGSMHAGKCVKGALSNDADKIEVAKNVMWKCSHFLRRIIVSHNEAGSVTLSCVCHTAVSCRLNV